eukprot:EG_transcript_39894
MQLRPVGVGLAALAAVLVVASVLAADPRRSPAAAQRLHHGPAPRPPPRASAGLRPAPGVALQRPWRAALPRPPAGPLSVTAPRALPSLHRPPSSPATWGVWRATAVACLVAGIVAALWAVALPRRWAAAARRPPPPLCLATAAA